MQSNSENRVPAVALALSPEDIARIIGPNTVYIREVGIEELKGSGVLPVDTPVPPTQKFFALHSADGRRVAVVDSRDMAFVAARQHELEPVSVH
ncbi:MAG: DUF1150 domain-containing protein [Alphaproteobacteria bacterium]|nr:DUF1150 domain-containing protein [Alphaproteobacteria bacterium]